MNRSEKIAALNSKKEYNFDDLCMIMELLRSEGGCPWDREQTHESIRRDFIEETYEVIEAIDTKDPELLREELGDVLLQVVFHARIEEEQGTFVMADVLTEICAKLIHRHPHIFADVVAETSEKVLTNWDIIKNEEKQRETITSRLRSVPPSLPALMKAAKVGKRAACFDFPDAKAAFAKIGEESAEIAEVMGSGNKERLEEEIGDLLFSVSNFARKSGIDPEMALNNATKKFIDRFEMIENEAIQNGKNVEKMSQKELDELWEAKKAKKLSKL
ncbi:MAG: nucleoside triphosphate pyrophosphohydrolase [Clostridia bacterium]|nr:nucleoside triphosphate pyrophosphohydrolase [Clostridia bacterium]